MRYGLLLGQDMAVATWTWREFNVFPIPVYKAIGILDIEEEKLIGGALFQNYTGTNIDLSYYGYRTLTLGIVKSLAQIALGFGIARGTVITSKRNRRFIRSLLKIGFRLEGTQRCFYGHEDNTRNTGVRLVIFKDGLTKLAGKNGQISTGSKPNEVTAAPKTETESQIREFYGQQPKWEQ